MTRPGPTNAATADVAASEFAREVMAGLSLPRKKLPCRFFYDEIGSELFEEITRTRDYYPTRVETEILHEHAAALAEGSEGAVLVEFGSGSSLKTELLLAQAQGLRAYVPIDVSPSALRGAKARLAERFPGLRVAPIVADFTTATALPDEFDGAPRVGFFPGSTIGNFDPEQAAVLLGTMGETLGRGARLIVGYDLRKDARRLVAAYNDDQGVTADFNLNLLARINRELCGTFDLQFFRHEAVWNPRDGRVEMYLISERAQTVEVLGTPIDFAAEERIHTENSYKFAPYEFALLARSGGWTTTRSVTDAERLFAVAELRRE